MRIFRRLFHRHTWRTLRVEYRYKDWKTGHRIAVKRCQCRECGVIRYLHFDQKEIFY